MRDDSKNGCVADYKNTGLKMYRYRDEKISKTKNKVTVANRDVENLDHQNWQLLEGKSYIMSISIIKQKLS